MVCCHDNGNVGLHMCAKFHYHCSMLLIKGYGNIRSHRLRLVAIGYKYATGCHDNGNVGLHVCAKFHEHHTLCFVLIR